VRETVHTGKRRVIRPLLRSSVALAAAAIAAVALAMPAHAEDSSTPAPLMLGKSAAIPPEDTQALPADVTPPVDPSVDVTPPDVQKIPAKSTRAEQTSTVRNVRTRTSSALRHVISVERSNRVIADGAGRARPVAGWYQVAEGQYRGVRAEARRTHVNTSSSSAPRVHAGARATVRGTPQSDRSAPVSSSHKCVELCAGDGRYNVSWNASHIAACILALPSPAGRERLCGLMAERLRAVLIGATATRSTTQYQPAGTQYQASGPEEMSVGPVTAASTGWELVAPASAKHAIHVARNPSAAAATATQATRHTTEHVLAAVAVQRKRAADRARLSAPTVESAPRSVRQGSSVPAVATGGASSTDWFLRTLIVLLGVAVLALLLPALSEVEGVAMGVRGLGSRVRSRGLGTSRVELGEDAARGTERRRRTISYRD
jgi:hypothetical protein